MTTNSSWLAAHGSDRRVPGRRDHPRRGRPGVLLPRAALGDAGDVAAGAGRRARADRSDHRGAYTGAFNFYITNQNVPQVYPATARAVTDCRLFELPAAELGRAVREWYPMAAHLLEGVTTQGMESRDTIERHERLVALGSVTAGLTHELNNPVAAVMRASARLREMLAEMREKLGLLVQSQLPGEKLEAVADLAARALASSPGGPGPVADRSVRSRGRGGATGSATTGSPRRGTSLRHWSPPGLGIDWLEALVAVTPPPHLEYGLSYPVRAIESDNLLDEITHGVERIAGLLASARQYTQMDRAPLQTFDVHEGLDATLTMLRHKLGDDIEVSASTTAASRTSSPTRPSSTRCGRT